MNVTTANKKLQLVIERNDKKVVKEFGTIRAKLLILRVSALLTAESLEDVRYATGHFHELVGDRKGQWACDLDQPFRLIFEPHEEPIPTDKDGKYIWIEIKEVELLEVTNYHGK